MNDLEFLIPTPQHKINAEEFKKEFFDHNETLIYGSALFDQMEYNEWLDNTMKNSSPLTVRKDWVVATTYFVIRKTDNNIIGMLDIRHNLDNDFLAQYGGNIGYAVRPSERKKGYASQILKMALTYTKLLGLKRIMISSYSDNIASIKTITKCGGVLTKTKPYIDGNPMNIYWIEL